MVETPSMKFRFPDDFKIDGYKLVVGFSKQTKDNPIPNHEKILFKDPNL